MKIKYVVGPFARYKLEIDGIRSMILPWGSFHIHKEDTTLNIGASFTIVLFEWGSIGGHLV